MLPLVTLMLTVPTLLGASPVHVTKDTMEMKPFVKVRTTNSVNNVIANHHATLTSDIDECADATTCDSNANCTNTPGSFTCTCNQGYTGNETICEGKNY